MEITATELKDVYIIKPQLFSDNRGWFMESWSEKAFLDKDLPKYNWVQDNHSYSMQKGVLRGLHFQKGQASQAKIVRCTKGCVLDVVVDLRQSSPTYLRWLSMELTADNKKQLLIPRGFAHGFLTLTDEVEFLYKTDNYYNAKEESGIIWNDPDINISWGIDNPLLSDKDQKLLKFKDVSIDFVYKDK